MYFYDGKYVEAAKNFRRSLDLTETMVKAKG